MYANQMYETRNINKLEKIMHKTSMFEKGPYYSCVAVFERLPNSIKCLPTKSFKIQFNLY